MNLDDLYQLRQCLHETRERINGKLSIPKHLIIESLDAASEIVAIAILEVKHKSGR